MRVLATVLSIAMWPGGVAFAAAPPPTPPIKPVATASSTPVPPSSAAADAAAARHAKRTACRKLAAEKKVLATERTDFIKQCMQKP